MACNPNVIGTMGLSVVERAIPTEQSRSAPKSFAIAIRYANRRSQMVVEVPMLALLVLIFAVSALVTPDFQLRLVGWSIPHFSGSPLFVLTGIPCLLCGMTRSFLAMGSLDIRQAFLFHPLGPFLYILLAGLAGALAASLLRRRRVHISLGTRLRRGLITWGALFLILAWVIKVFVWRHTGLL